MQLQSLYLNRIYGFIGGLHTVYIYGSNIVTAIGLRKNVNGVCFVL